MCLRNVFLVSLSFFYMSSFAQKIVEKPALVVGIVVDQMCWDYLYKYSDNFGDGGFKRLKDDGFSFEQHYIPYAITFTAPGHASIYTGALPALNGIISNTWVDRASESMMYCVSDSIATSIGGSSKNGAMSPANLLASTVGDELKRASNFESKVFGISIKDRGAILAGGHTANGAFWFDDSTGKMISSSHYYDELPIWVQQFNRRAIADSFLKQPWKLSEHTTFNDREAAKPIYKNSLENGVVPDFPYMIKEKGVRKYRQFKYIPYANTYTIMFAKQLIAQEGLGKDAQTDMLGISFSTPDYAGHKFGAQSPEVADIYTRLDRDIETLLNYLDKEIGKDKYVVFLSSDHGVALSTDYMKQKKFNAGNLNLYAVKDSINQLLKMKFGYDQLLYTYYESQFYLSHKNIEKNNLVRDDVYKELAKIVNNYPQVMTTIDMKNIHAQTFPPEYLKMIAGSYFDGRSGDMLVVFKPYHTEYFGTGSDHGSFFNYDRHLPMLWYGWKIPQGKSYRKTYITDIAPTISAMLNIPTPNAANGEVMVELFDGN